MSSEYDNIICYQKNGSSEPKNVAVTFFYSLRLANGVEIFSNFKDEPCRITVGRGEVLPVVEDKLLNIDVGVVETIFLTASMAFGPVLNENFKKFSSQEIPEEARQKGRKVAVVDPRGEERILDVIDVFDDYVIVDFNHPLAGKDLIVDVKVISVEYFSGVDR